MAQIGVYIAALMYYCGEVLQAIPSFCFDVAWEKIRKQFDKHQIPWEQWWFCCFTVSEMGFQPANIWVKDDSGMITRCSSLSVPLTASTWEFMLRLPHRQEKPLGPRVDLGWLLSTMSCSRRTYLSLYMHTYVYTYIIYIYTSIYNYIYILYINKTHL